LAKARLYFVALEFKKILMTKGIFVSKLIKLLINKNKYKYSKIRNQKKWFN